MPRANARIAVLLIALLCVSAIVNVAVAWAVAWWMSDIQRIEDSEAGVATAFDNQGRVTESWWVERYEGFGTTMLVSGRYLYKPRPMADFDGIKHPVDVLPRWAEFDPPSPEFVSGQAEGDTRVAELRGWPVRALGLTLYYDFAANQFRSSMAINPSPGNTRAGDPRLLPLRPMWPGFLINTLFYAIILWILFTGPGKVRRVLRRKRRLCPACAYPTWGGESAVCTECGNAIARDAG